MDSNEFDLIIEPGRTEKNYWGDLWRYRELFYILVWRDFKVRYKQTVIGIAWSVLRPLLLMIVITLVFRKLANLPSEGNTPYAILTFAALLPWNFFANALTESSNSLVGNANLISKVYFPRLIIPSSSIMSGFIDFLITFLLMVGFMIFYKFTPSWHIVLFPVFLLIAFIASFGIGLYLTTLNLKYRDFRIVVPFIIQFGFYLSPVGYSSTIIPEKWRLLYSLNPMVGVIDGFRWCIIGDESNIYWPGFGVSLAVMVFFAIFALWHFRKTEKEFADYI